MSNDKIIAKLSGPYIEMLVVAVLVLADIIWRIWRGSNEKDMCTACNHNDIGKLYCT